MLKGSVIKPNADEVDSEDEDSEDAELNELILLRLEGLDSLEVESPIVLEELIPKELMLEVVISAVLLEIELDDDILLLVYRKLLRL
jgi:hypothetical protein